MSTDNDELVATQNKRWDLIAKIEANTIDPKTAAVIGKLVDGVDKQILTRQRIQIETKTGETNEALAREIIQAIRKDSKGADTARIAQPIAAVSFTLPEDPAPDVEVVQGGTSVGVCIERFDEFQGRMEKGEIYTGKEMDETPKAS